MKINVVCGILKFNDLYLIAKRGKGVHEGVWEFPGGKVEDEETQELAIIREFKEELGIDVEVVQYITSIVDKRKDVDIFVHAYLLQLIKGKPTLHVHTELKYVSVKELMDYSFEEADLPILQAIVNKM